MHIGSPSAAIQQFEESVISIPPSEDLYGNTVKNMSWGKRHF
jgi:type IV secretory pathway ATPase VirB11/archaellum biosynthesis ATPase